MERVNVKKLFNKAKKHGEWDNYRKALTIYNKHVRKAKQDSWRKFCKEIDSISEGARLQRVLRRDEPIMVGSLKDEFGKFVNSGKGVLEIMAKTHFPGARGIFGNEDWHLIGSVKRINRDLWTYVLNYNNVRWIYCYTYGLLLNRSWKLFDTEVNPCNTRDNFTRFVSYGM